MVLFGSRAKGTALRGSDVDLALKGKLVTDRTVRRLANALEESALPYFFDIAIYQRNQVNRFHGSYRCKLYVQDCSGIAKVAEFDQLWALLKLWICHSNYQVVCPEFVIPIPGMILEMIFAG